MLTFFNLSKRFTPLHRRFHRREPGMGDMVSHPDHYTIHPVFTGECHDYAKYMTFDQGNAFKYLWRCAGKGDMEENIRKALWYLNAMRTGPVLARRGNRLARVDIHKLAVEVSEAMDGTCSSTAPKQLMAALACYAAGVRVADGDVDDAAALTNHALDLLKADVVK